LDFLAFVFGLAFGLAALARERSKALWSVSFLPGGSGIPAVLRMLVQFISRAYRCEKCPFWSKASHAKGFAWGHL